MQTTVPDYDPLLALAVLAIFALTTYLLVESNFFKGTGWPCRLSPPPKPPKRKKALRVLRPKQMKDGSIGVQEYDKKKKRWRRAESRNS